MRKPDTSVSIAFRQLPNFRIPASCLANRFGDLPIVPASDDPTSAKRGPKECGFALLASQIIISEQYGSRKLVDGTRTLSPHGLARALGRTPQIVEDRLNGKAAIRPAEARTIISYTGDVRLAQWMLEGTPFLPALRPENLRPAGALMRSGLSGDAARVHASAVDLAHEAGSLLQAAIGAVRDLQIDAADRSRLKSEIADVATALATLQVALNETDKTKDRSE